MDRSGSATPGPGLSSPRISYLDVESGIFRAPGHINAWITFKSISDVKQVLGTPVHDTVRELVAPVIESFSDSAPYCPEDDGYLALIEPGDVDRVLNEIDMPRLVDFPWEE